MSNKKPLHLMTKDELDYEFFKMTGIKPVPPNASQREHDDYKRLLEINYDSISAEIARRLEAGTLKQS